jgi:hypothetical protein
MLVLASVGVIGDGYDSVVSCIPVSNMKGWLEGAGAIADRSVCFTGGVLGV